MFHFIFVYMIVIYLFVYFLLQNDHCMRNSIILNDVKNTYMIHYKPFITRSILYVIFGSLIFFMIEIKGVKEVLIFTLLLLSHFGINFLKLVFQTRVQNHKHGKNTNCGLLKRLKISKMEEQKSKLLYGNIESVVYVIDQILHLIVIYFIASILRTFEYREIYMELLEYSSLLKLLFDNINIVLILLLITSFFNTSFKELTKNGIKFNEPEYTPYYIRNAGAIIGNLERIIILICLVTDNFATIGFIIAVKSIARFTELTKKEFSEYYIIGTLSSVIFTILMFYLLIG